jgi:hypothetical protein
MMKATAGNHVAISTFFRNKKLRKSARIAIECSKLVQADLRHNKVKELTDQLRRLFNAIPNI